MEYDTINEMLKRYNTGELDLTDEEAELLAMNAQRFGSEFKSRSKPLRKGAFDFMDMATFGLLPNQWRPTSQAQNITGETGLDRFAGGVGSVAGLATGITGAVKGLGMASKAITARGGIKGAVASAKEAQAVKRANAYAKSLYNKGENIVGAGAGRVADYTSRAAEFAAQSPGLQTAGNVARGLGGSAAALGRAGYGRLPSGVRERTSPVLRRIQELLNNPAGLTIPGAQGLESLNPYSYIQPRNPLSFGRQKGGYIPGYQEGGEYPKIKRTVGIPGVIGGKTKFDRGAGPDANQYTSGNWDPYDVNTNFPERNLWDKFTDFGKPWRDERNVIEAQSHINRDRGNRPMIVPEELRDDPEYAYLNTEESKNKVSRHRLREAVNSLWND